MLIVDMIYPVYLVSALKPHHNRIITDFQDHVTHLRVFNFFKGITCFKFTGPQSFNFGK